MRIPKALLYAVVALGVVGAFAAGRYVGKQDAEKVTAAGVELFNASRSAETFFIASRTREAIRQADLAAAEAVLVRYAAIQVPTLAKCAESPECVAWVGKLMPGKASLDDALAAEAALRNRK